ncbi:ABC transporter permease [Proteiniborus sp. MB09-C3]|uniref:ABC transporter permease n=1 Tax=Proteiniborus sp. MB09-C3 TaxID=3050072 RepID=UPI002557A631|nr:ABC transporter permease [Proteiniborus sp. MB09-C3]WIV13914.1 ABC transporter permease [Proteiniborus sp. MB09-C3]
MIYCEFLKLKRSKICIIALVGTLGTPLLTIMHGIQNHFVYPEKAISLFGLYDNGIMFLMLLFGPLVFSIIAAYLFSREYAEKTLKTLFVVPITKRRFLASKFMTLFLCLLFLMILSWAEIFILAAICNIVFEISELNFLTALYFLFKIIYGSILLYATITPFAFLAIYSKGLVAPIIVASIIALGNVILTNSPIAGYFPWTATYLLLNGRIQSSGSTPGIVFTIVGLVCFISILSSILYFQKEDIK